MGKELFIRDRQFEGITNLKVVKLLEKINTIKKENKERLKKQTNILEKIQRNCNHEYLLYAKGQYEDSYTCHLCGHEKEN